MFKAAVPLVFSIALSIAVQEQWPDQAGYFWVLSGALLVVLAATWIWPRVLPSLGEQLAPYVIPHLPPPATPSVPTALAEPFEDPEVSERRQMVGELRAMVADGQALRAKMSHATEWLADIEEYDAFGYSEWRAKVRDRLIDLRPEDADHFTKPPIGPDLTEYDDYQYTEGLPNRDMLSYLDEDLEVLTRLLKFYAA